MSEGINTTMKLIIAAVVILLVVGVAASGFGTQIIDFFKGLGTFGNQTSENQTEPDDTIPSQVYIDRYNELKDYFEYYDKRDRPFGYEKRFKPLLVGIAQSASDLGYPGGVKNSDWLMGYKINIAKYKGAEKQIYYSEYETLTPALKALPGQGTGNYKPCAEIKAVLNSNAPGYGVSFYDRKTECVISVWISGVSLIDGKFGTQISDTNKNQIINTIINYYDWMKYFYPEEVSEDYIQQRKDAIESLK